MVIRTVRWTPGSDENVFGLSEAQIARWVKAAARAADLPRLREFQRPQRAAGMAQRQPRPPAW